MFHIWGEGRGGSRSRSGWRGGLGGLPTPLVVLSAGCTGSALLFLPTLCFCFRLLKSGSWVFCSLCIFCPESALTAKCRQLFFIPYSFFVFYCWRRGCSGISFAAVQQRVPDPRPVSFPTERLYVVVLKMLKVSSSETSSY